jgi:MFS family permease
VTGNRVDRRALSSLCAAVGVSEIGDWLLFIALPLVVLQGTGSTLATSAVFLAELVPAVIFGTVCGPLIDRRDPGRLLWLLTVTQALVVLPLIWARPGQVWLVCVVAAVQAAFTSVSGPSQQAIVPQRFTTAQTPRVNALVITISNVARLVGSPLGGVLLPVLGLHGLVLVDIATFLLSGGALIPLLAPPRRRVASPAGGVGSLAAIAQGVDAVRHDRTLTAALVIAFLASVAQGLFLVLFVLFVLRSLHAGDGLVGLLRGVQAIGGVLGGVLVTVALKKTSPRALAISGLAAFAVVSAVSWNSPHLTTAPALYIALFIAVGVPATLLQTGFTSVSQQFAAPHLRGRVLSLIAVAEALGQAAGILAAGILSGTVALELLLNAQAGCYGLCALIACTSLAVAPRRRGADGPVQRPRVTDRRDLPATSSG